MAQHMDNTDPKSIELIKELMELERMAMEEDRRHASRTAEPELKSLLLKLTKTHEQSFEDLQTFLGEVNSRNEITQQINEMFL